ncbi:hypothetical protein UlMin_036861 [Ulmus minor]
MEQRSQSSSSTKIERRIVEKNRRNQMKILYSNLFSLLPNPNSKAAASVLTLPDQIDETINYIKSLETKLNKCKEKKKSLSGRKRSYNCTNSSTIDSINGSLKPPQIETHEMGSILEIVLITGLDNQFIFYEFIRILHEEGVDVVNTMFSVVQDSIFHVVHAELPDVTFAFGAAKITEKLKRFVSGSSSYVELLPEFWDDFEIHPKDLGVCYI